MSRSASRQVSAAAVLVAGAWGLVLALTVLHVPGRSTATSQVAGPVQALLWLGTATWTVVLLRGRAARLRWQVTTVVLALVGGTTLVSWGAWAPRAYYATHRWAFAAAAPHVGGRASSDPLGQPLPLPWSTLSVTGRVATLWDARGQAVTFLPQAYGIPDGGAGFVHVGDGGPPDGLYDLFGDPVRIADGVDLGDGWWYVR